MQKILNFKQESESESKMDGDSLKSLIFIQNCMKVKVMWSRSNLSVSVVLIVLSLVLDKESVDLKVLVYANIPNSEIEPFIAVKRDY